jgi:hypothetical protein
VLTGQPIAYGAYGAFNHAIATGNTGCANATFGDPIPGEAKACHTPTGFRPARAAENATCAFAGARTSPGAFAYRTFSGGTACTMTAFGGHPLPGAGKSRY